MEVELSAAEMIASVSEEAPAEAEGGAGSHGTQEQAQPAVKAAPPPTWDPKALKYVVDGKEIVEPWEMVQKRAQLGYNYAQRAEKLKQEFAAIEKTREENTRLQEKNKSLAKWKQYDEFARTNEAWAKHVEDAWNNRNANPAASEENPLAGHFKSMQEKIAALEARDQAREEAAERAKQEADKVEANKGLDSQIAKTREQYKDVDFDTTDEQGRSLEFRVLEHMQTLGHDGRKPGQFLAAFRDVYFDNLVAKKIETTKESHAKEIQKQRKSGLLGVSPTPTIGSQSNGFSKNMSYEDLADLVKKDMGLI